MELYLLKASAILALFLGAYQGLLRKETFFRLNRFFLLGGIGAALLLPLVSIRTEVMIPMQLAEIQPGTAATETTGEGSQVVWETLLWILYSGGALFFLWMAGKQLRELFRLTKDPGSHRKEGYVLVPTDRVSSPFSFFRYIFYNPASHGEQELELILEHEKAHARQLHSLDVLLGRATAILLWMNPLAWWYQKSIQQNLEYLADAQAVERSPSLQEYQYTLLKVSGNPLTPALVSSFKSSLIKKRIVMMQQNQSKTIHLLKYLLILPVLAGFLMAFNRETVFVPQDTGAQELFLPGEKTIEVTIDKNTSDSELLELKEKMAKDGIDFSYTTVRNDAGEIIDISFNISGKAENGSPFNGTYNSNSEEPIKPVVIYINSEGGIFFGQASTFEKFKKGTEVHSGTKSDKEMIWVHRTGDEATETIEIRKVNGKEVFIVDGEEVPDEEFEKAYLRNLGEREKHWIQKAQNSKTIRVREEDGKQIITVDGEEVSREELGKEGKAERIFVKMLETDEDPAVEVKIHEIEVKEDGEVDRIIEIAPDKGSEAKYQTVVIDLDQAGDYDNVMTLPKDKKMLFFVDGKKASRKAISKLDPDQIESINVWKGDKAVEQYGKKAKDGVVEITTKKQ